VAIFHFRDHYLRENSRLDISNGYNKRAIMIINNEVIIERLRNWSTNAGGG